MESIELNNIWGQIKEALLEELPESAHPWIYPLEMTGFDNGVLTVVTGQLMGRDLLRKSHYNQIVNVIKKFTDNKDADFVIIYDANAAKSLKKENERLQKKATEAVLKEKAIENLSYMQSASNLNLKYKFENFVVGKNNEFAYKVTKSVAENPAGKYNPLFIYGKSGLGKTHLMQAIGHYVLFNNPKLKVKYTKTEDYVNDFISNSRKSKDTIENMSKFYKKYSNIDIILVDDIQFLESKGRTMLQMQHTFDSLYNKGKQIVITSDRLPKEIPTLSSALCSRFEMGLMIELLSPDFQNRFDIVKKMAIDNDIDYTDEALKYIADNFTSNVRELEGAFNKVAAYSEIVGIKFDINAARAALKCQEKSDGLSFDTITNVTARYYNVDVNDILGTARGQNVSQARHMAIYLARELSGKSCVNIAEYFNKKHTTIMYSYEKLKKELVTNKNLVKSFREIKQVLKVL